MSFTPIPVSELLPRDNLASQLNIRYVDGGEDYVLLEVTLDERHLNFMGKCHGGVVFALADTALGLACNAKGNLSVAIDAHITFVKAVSVGDVLRARATHIASSRKTAVYNVEIYRKGEALATFTGTVFKTGKELCEHLPDSLLNQN
tara:strand:+ start:399 stop:839 length:441 start_codon:yes stop_codon:yes gene_type:complete